MAKGNLILGTARGSIGDVTLYRYKGKQVSRARNRSIKNPKSIGQRYQRAILATVAQAYRAGKAIFDHSFQGKSVPDGSFNEFRKKNIAYLRQALVSDVSGNTAAANCRLAVVPMGATSPVANAYIISAGTLIQGLYNITMAANDLKATPISANEGETVAQYAARLGLQDGDIYTICAFGSFETVSFDKAVPTMFGFIRFIFKASALTSETTMATAQISDLFEIDAEGTQIPDSQLFSTGITLDQVVPSATSGCIGVIRSRKNSGERSNCQMVFASQIDTAALIPTNGIKTTYLADAWTDGSKSLAESSLILEGGNF